MDDGQRDLAAELERHYGVVDNPALRRAELRTIGCDYGATSYTTRSQADELATELRLRPDTTLLEVGAGAGWPGLYVAGVTGCRVILTDPVVKGLHVAARRAATEGVNGWAMVASGDALPLPDDSVDAVACSDVFC